MSGKLLVAGLLAASTASAATLGVVYTGTVSPRHTEAEASESDTPSPTGTVKSAIVLNAQESVLGRFAEFGDAPVCPSKANATGCVMVSRASEIHLNILGYTVAIPPVWLGGNSEDHYFPSDIHISTLGATPMPPTPWIQVLGRRRAAFGARAARTDGGAAPARSSTGEDSSAGSQTASTIAEPAGLAQVSGDTAPSVVDLGATPIVYAVPVSLAGDASIVFPDAAQPPLIAGLPAIAVPVPPVGSTIPVISNPPKFGGNVPEPSTWAMTLAGLAALGLFKRWRGRRGALPPAAT